MADSEKDIIITPELYDAAAKLEDEYYKNWKILKILIMIDHRLDFGLGPYHPDAEKIVEDQRDDFETLFTALDRTMMNVVLLGLPYSLMHGMIEQHSILVNDISEARCDYSMYSDPDQYDRVSDTWNETNGMKDRWLKKAIAMKIMIIHTHDFDKKLPTTKTCKRFMSERCRDIANGLNMCHEKVHLFLVAHAMAVIGKDILENHVSLTEDFIAVKRKFKRWLLPSIEQPVDFFLEIPAGTPAGSVRRSIKAFLDTISVLKHLRVVLMEAPTDLTEGYKKRRKLIKELVDCLEKFGSTIRMVAQYKESKYELKSLLKLREAIINRQCIDFPRVYFNFYGTLGLLFRQLHEDVVLKLCALNFA